MELPTPPWRVLVPLWMIAFATACQYLIVGPILSRIGEELLVPEAWRGVLVSAYAVCLSASALVAGPFIDRLGAWRVLRTATLALAVALIAHALPVGFVSMLCVRGLAGIAGGMTIAATTAYVASAVPYSRRGWVMGFIASALAFGDVAGIPAGTLSAEMAGFRTPFVGTGAVLALGYLLMVTTPPAVLAHEGSPENAPLTSQYRALFNQPRIARIASVAFLQLFAIGAYSVYFPSWLETSLGATSHHIAAMFLVGGTVKAIAGPAAGSLSDRVGRKQIIVLATLGIACAVFVTTRIPNLAGLAALFVVLMGMSGARSGTLQALITGHVNRELQGSLASLFLCIGQIGYALGATAAGAAYGSVGFWANTWMAAGSSVVLALVVGLGLTEPKLCDPR